MKLGRQLEWSRNVKYHPCGHGCLTALRHPEPGPCMVGSLTGAVASQSVTEAPNGSLRVDGHHPLRV